MSESVMLPYQMPFFATTQGIASAGIAIMAHPTAYNAVLTQSTALNCTRRFLKGYTTPQIGIPRAGIYNFPFFERQTVSLKFAHSHCREIIKQMLDEGYYIYYTEVDDFYMPGKSWFGIRHHNHDGIICGYDESDKTYSIAAYDVNWVFNLIRIPQECFMEGLASCLAQEQYGNLIGYKITQDDIPLKEGTMRWYLKEYLKADIEKFSLEDEGEVVGIAVHDFLAMYIDKLKDGSIPSEKMDWRALRPVWEHKRCMLDRIRAIEARRNWNDELSAAYEPIVEEANRLRVMYSIYHKTKKASLLDGIRNGLLHIKKAEKEILTTFVERMEEKKS